MMATAEYVYDHDEDLDPVLDPSDHFSFRVATMEKAKKRLAETTERVSRINDALKSYLSPFVAQHPLGEVLDQIVALEDEVNALDDAFKVTKAQISLVREVLFPERLDAEDTKSTSSSVTGNRVTRTARVFAAIRSDKTGSIMEAAYKWLRENELGALIKETVNSSSLSAAAKEMMESGRELPDDIFNTYMKDGVTITRSKKK